LGFPWLDFYFRRCVSDVLIVYTNVFASAPAPAPKALGCYQTGQVNVTLCLAKTRNVAIVWLAAANA
jgi:hypothetical protein